MSILTRAINFAKEQHYYEERKNGDPYIKHPLNVLKLLLPYRLSERTKAAAILHDVCENTKIRPSELQEHFGTKVSMLVYGLTKEKKELFCGDSEKRTRHYMEKLRQMALLYPEILLIKMADQVDNLDSLDVFPEWKQRQQREEVRKFFFPLYESFGERMPEELRTAYRQLFSDLCEQAAKQ